MNGSDSLVLDIGGDIGALVIHAGSDLLETQIEISPAASPGGKRTHNVVHARRNPHGVRYSAVFPDVPAGDYVIWRNATTPDATVTVRGGQVTEHHRD
ncbi:MAG TPA: hypothetical protein VH352_15570 [Pseudonocardiaceae bacterium]|nr:hypothetical protein [Pseudonocardiaceae bacterium]